MQANTLRCEHECRRMQGSFYSNAPAFFLLFLIAQMQTQVFAWTVTNVNFLHFIQFSIASYVTSLSAL